MHRNKKKSKVIKISTSSTKVSWEANTPSLSNRNNRRQQANYPRQNNNIVNRHSVQPINTKDSTKSPSSWTPPILLPSLNDSSDDHDDNENIVLPRHPSHVPTPDTIRDMQKEEENEEPPTVGKIRGIPSKLNNMIKQSSKRTIDRSFTTDNGSSNKSNSGLDWVFWGANGNRRSKRSSSTTSSSPQNKHEETMKTTLQQQWLDENRSNLQSALSSKRLLDRDIFNSSEILSSL